MTDQWGGSPSQDPHEGWGGHASGPPGWQAQQPGPLPGQPPMVAYGHTPGSNGFAIASMVLGIVWVYWVGSLLAVIFGHIALTQIDRTGQSGRGMAIAGLVLGYVGLAFLVIVLILVAAAVDSSDDSSMQLLRSVVHG